MDDPSVCPRLYTDELPDELSFFVVRLDSSSCVYTLQGVSKKVDNFETSLNLAKRLEV